MTMAMSIWRTLCVLVLYFFLPENFTPRAPKARNLRSFPGRTLPSRLFISAQLAEGQPGPCLNKNSSATLEWHCVCLTWELSWKHSIVYMHLWEWRCRRALVPVHSHPSVLPQWREHLTSHDCTDFRRLEFTQRNQQITKRVQWGALGRVGGNSGQLIGRSGAH